jgi:hypothetical protein
VGPIHTDHLDELSLVQMQLTAAQTAHLTALRAVRKFMSESHEPRQLRALEHAALEASEKVDGLLTRWRSLADRVFDGDGALAPKALHDGDGRASRHDGASLDGDGVDSEEAALRTRDRLIESAFAYLAHLEARLAPPVSVVLPVDRARDVFLAIGTPAQIGELAQSAAEWPASRDD